MLYKKTFTMIKYFNQRVFQKKAINVLPKKNLKKSFKNVKKKIPFQKRQKKMSEVV